MDLFDLIHVFGSDSVRILANFSLLFVLLVRADVRSSFLSPVIVLVARKSLMSYQYFMIILFD